MAVYNGIPESMVDLKHSTFQEQHPANTSISGIKITEFVFDKRKVCNFRDINHYCKIQIFLIQINIPLTIHKWLPLPGYCGIQYSECSASDSMSINVAETGDESEIGSNCAEDWIEIEGMSSKCCSSFSLYSI